MSLVETVLEKMRVEREGAAGAVPGGARVQGHGTTFGTVVPTHGRGAEVHHIGQPPSHIVEIDLTALRVAGLLPPPHQERQIGKQYRQIKRPLLANARGRGSTRLRNAHVIMMASALQGEGKTFTCINLAFSLALEKDVKIVLIDGDAPKPHISRLFGIDKEPGLLDLLRDSSLSAESLILPTNVPSLYVLPVGHRSSDTATELLSSARMQELVASISAADPQRILLFDSPPLLLTTESRALAEVAGQIAMVVRAGGTSHQAVMDGISQLGADKSVGFILNQSKGDTSGHYYGYGDYGYGAADASEGRNRSG
jgi:protein-tyrosine kinase